MKYKVIWNTSVPPGEHERIFSNKKDVKQFVARAPKSALNLKVIASRFPFDVTNEFV